MTADPSAIDQVIAARRTSLLVDVDHPVADHLIDEVIEAATWAPNHKRTWPWRFTVISGGARSRFGETLAAAASAVGLKESKVEKLRTKYLRSPVVVVVWVAVATDEVRAREDRDATAAAVQNLLLAATARGLASYWGTLADDLVPAARAACAIGDDHDLIALVYLGWPTGEVSVPERPAPDITRLA